MIFSFVGYSYATGTITITVSVYGKGGVSGGGSGVIVCPEKDNAVCATISVQLPSDILSKSSGNGSGIIPGAIIYLHEEKRSFQTDIIQSDILDLNLQEGTAIFENVILK